MTISPEQWLGLLLVTEARRRSEREAWVPIAWLVRNRVESRRFRPTVEACVLQPRQFSKFNDWAPELAEGGPVAVWDAAGRWSKRERGLDALRAEAEEVARVVLEADRAAAPFSSLVLHFYSPQSMTPPGSVPGWWFREIAREVPIHGLNPDAFRFGESHASGRR